MTDSGGAVPSEPRVQGGVGTALAVALTLGAIAWAADLFRAAGLLLYTEQFLCGMLGLALPLVFLTERARKSASAGAPWYD